MKQDKINREIRKRHYTYTLLDYILSNSTYFDFFSLDTFQVLMHTKYVGSICLSTEKVIGSEFFLFSFLTLDLPIKKFLEDHNISSKEMGLLISSVNQLNTKALIDKKDFYFRKIFKDFQLSKIQPLKYAHEVNLLLEKTAENALLRFKTPVITPEIFLITLMEEKNNKSGKLLKKLLKTESNWYLLRYKLIKRIHLQESEIKSKVKKNEHYFTYLLKICLSELEFNTLIEQNSLATGSSFFRNQVVYELLSLDFLKMLYHEIHNSLANTAIRKYSF
jgi:hypothetical protein